MSIGTPATMGGAFLKAVVFGTMGAAGGFGCSQMFLHDSLSVRTQSKIVVGATALGAILFAATAAATVVPMPAAPAAAPSVGAGAAASWLPGQ
jgi:hypothetical protein